MARQEQRVLYDETFLELGCPDELLGDVVDLESSNVDNLPWTWGTNYAVAIMGALVALALYVKHSRRHTSSSMSENSSVVLIWYFLFTTVGGFGLAGISHQLTDDKEEDFWTDSVLYTCTTISSLFGSICLQWIILSFYGLFPKMTTTTTFGFMIGAVYLVVIVTSIFIPLIANVFNSITYFSILLVYIHQLLRIHNNNNNKSNNSSQFSDNNEQCIITKSILPLLIKALAIAILIVSFFVQIGLKDTCGSGGYKDCFVDCPLPNPKVFNHNAIFHLLAMGGFLTLGVSEYMNPSSLYYPNARQQDQKQQQQQAKLTSSSAPSYSSMEDDNHHDDIEG